jgi:predicted glutamine amidotransferase
MCGIAGILRVGDEPITPEQVKTLLIGVQHRGGDATGIALMNGGELHYHKKDEIAWKFCATPETDRFLKTHLTKTTDVVILHTRAATQGMPYKNENNHPLTKGKTAIVHNGMIHNDDDLFNRHKFARSCETDSDIIRAILDEEGLTPKGVRALNTMRGSCAMAAISSAEPNKLLLARSGSPLILAHTENQFMWASVKDPIHKAARTWEYWRGMWYQATKPKLMFNPMMMDEALIIDIDRFRNEPDTYEPWCGEFKTCTSYTAPVYRVHENFPNKQRTFKEKKAQEQATAAREDASEKSEADEARKRTQHGLKPIRCMAGCASDEDLVKCLLHGVTHTKDAECSICKFDATKNTVRIRAITECDKHHVTYSGGDGCPKCVGEKLAKRREKDASKKYAQATSKRLTALQDGQAIECDACGTLQRVGDTCKGKSIWELVCYKCGEPLLEMSEEYSN